VQEKGTTMARRLCQLLVCILAAAPAAAQTVDDLIALKRVGGTPAIAPDGTRVAFTVREANWEANEYESEIWLADAKGTHATQVTRGKGSSSQPAWSRDGRWLAFLSDRTEKRQVYRLPVGGGEAERLTDAEEPVTAFAWSPDGTRIAFVTTDPVTPAAKARTERWGDVVFEDQDARMAHLHVVDVATRRVRQVTMGAFVVGAFDWAPDGTRIAFDHRIDSDAGNGGSADISMVDVASGRITPLVTQAGPDANPKWSPDGTRIAFQSAMATPFYMFETMRLAAVTATSPGTPEVLTAAFDENPSLVAWTSAGIFFSASQRTWSYLYRLDPATKQATRHAVRDAWIGQSFAVTPDGRSTAFVGSGPRDFPEVYAAPVAATLAATRLSDLGAQLTEWPVHGREVVRWKSQDGAEIEGVLHKPAGFQDGRRYPLLVVIHGGPTGVSRPQPYGSYTQYPIDLWLAKGALVLEPNYRGSAGYGGAFRALNVRNLGIGDAWDVLSGIDALVAQGVADKDRVGAMGWSQGGYISMFLTTKHAERFKAISAGAGIADWMTYYVNTDIHPFTRQYLKATPWDDAAIYAETSPMTYIRQAKTPTLIQHGDKDARVPIPNAFQLYQGLRDVGVPVELQIFRGFGHGIDKPKANRAAMEKNRDWFAKYIWAEAATTTQPQ
jgi:dipeptidyl aminopeptidase/acylaminoacyl peptidase